jgi:hypothetical protein
MRQSVLPVAMLALIGQACVAAESNLKLENEPAAITVRARCTGCHSVDYVLMNAGILKREGWEAEVKKMITVMGAPVPEEEIPAIVDYLARRYGVP